ncbi:leucyl/phenylalanyl-tRNA--protein transferase [Sphingomonas astaxanthinifaciens]|uniref:Leucyl/phenylalanyl-tRNA--protein transferase n=1 Tax=Sphingomonas astaxanthinifaciens DSM 22298 TaxID=1123267 RepID=A0ABQ5ZAX5_9SPHN|nr:leucyl/phenylalanyl-tRNA--protein transferase [Sphingomonas astaxanthinifaciens]GLR48661.1 leucyl/phenylalanyl-tRNA--protein transferase [Sphingomonas astaxanthinifaciens DSM 22298]
MSARLDLNLLLRGYASGVFPMADSRDSDELFWVEPRTRAIIPLDRFHVSRSLAKRLRSGRFTVTADRDFAGVLLGCADREETWINRPIEQAMIGLFERGQAHSVEVWEEDRLVGGVYGVALGRAFFGESMFSRATDASKVALAFLVARLRAGHFTLLDCQFMTSHLASLGAVDVPRASYVGLLGDALGSASVPPEPDWRSLDGLLSSLKEPASSAAAGKFISQLLGQTS